MESIELIEKIKSLQRENDKLREEMRSLQIQLGIGELTKGKHEFFASDTEIKVPERAFQQMEIPIFQITKNSDSSEKIQLFKSLFRGRDDVYARRWENKKKGTAGYTPACGNEWKYGICLKPKMSCSDCVHKDYLMLTDEVTEYHLTGRNGLVVGIYPMLLNDTCYFLAIDFDDEGWQNDITTLRQICLRFDIPIAVERSRSGEGAHAWFFFEQPVAASLARKFGSSMLTHSMNERHEVAFKSYDRLFPNQDLLPKGGFGNLIALPLQKEARANKNSVFIDDKFIPYKDQWSFLSTIRKLSERCLEDLISKLCDGNELGVLKTDQEEEPKLLDAREIKLTERDFPSALKIIKSNSLLIPKANISQRALNQLKRLAAFKNPEFYKAQAMRMATFNKPRIICCADETTEYLCLPSGCETDCYALMERIGLEVIWEDQTNKGRKIDVEFNGVLRDDQPTAIAKLLEHDNGILCGTTAFGKTVVAIKLIAERKVSTLILVNKISLVSLWKDKLSEFLIINGSLPDELIHRGKKKTPGRMIGQLGGGKNELSGIIDIAVMQSLCREGEVKEVVKNYGMVIVDECHHVSAFSFELILKSVNAKYVYGLTATPSRKDGHHPIILMQCGPIRYRDDAKKQAEKRPFEHYIVPRFTSFKVPSWWEKEEKDLSITDLYAELVKDEMRNQLLIDDVIKCHAKGRNCIILTERTSHVEWLTKELGKRIPEVIPFMGKMGTREKGESMTRLSISTIDKPLVLVATGRFIGEGFDEPRLDTLFLAMPISWKGTLQQYAGRLHRLFEGKVQALIYDYVDIHIRMFEKMYQKRLSGYASIGYKARGESVGNDVVDIIFGKDNFLPVFINDIVNASREILIVSPFLTKARSLQMAGNLEVAIANSVKVTVVTRPVEESKGRDLVTWRDTVEMLESTGVKVVHKPNIHQKFAVVDQKIVWYGSINLFSYGTAEESIMRIVSYNIAYELTKIAF